MKRVYSLVVLLAMMVTALSFISCSKDDEENNGGNGSSNALVGTWDVISCESAEWDWYSNTYKPYTEYPDNEYWVFTAKNVTFYAKDDLANGTAVKYEYNAEAKTLSINSGFVTYKILELTATTLKVQTASSAVEVSVGDHTYDYPDTYVLKKR